MRLLEPMRAEDAILGIFLQLTLDYRLQKGFFQGCNATVEALIKVLSDLRGPSLMPQTRCSVFLLLDLPSSRRP